MNACYHRESELYAPPQVSISAAVSAAVHDQPALHAAAIWNAPPLASGGGGADNSWGKLPEDIIGPNSLMLHGGSAGMSSSAYNRCFEKKWDVYHVDELLRPVEVAYWLSDDSNQFSGQRWKSAENERSSYMGQKHDGMYHSCHLNPRLNSGSEHTNYYNLVLASRDSNLNEQKRWDERMAALSQGSPLCIVKTVTGYYNSQSSMATGLVCAAYDVNGRLIDKTCIDLVPRKAQ